MLSNPRKRKHGGPLTHSVLRICRTLETPEAFRIITDELEALNAPDVTLSELVVAAVVPPRYYLNNWFFS